jgi:hypothetical protein
MTYKETLFFIGKCLTISHELKNKKEVETSLKQNLIDWENIVKISTKHFVFPALYLNLKRTNLLSYVPKDLLEYMEHITQLNRERNTQIIKQARAINNLLLENNIRPVFFKGNWKFIRRPVC